MWPPVGIYSETEHGSLLTQYLWKRYAFYCAKGARQLKFESKKELQWTWKYLCMYCGLMLYGAGKNI